MYEGPRDRRVRERLYLINSIVFPEDCASATKRDRQTGRQEDKWRNRETGARRRPERYRVTAEQWRGEYFIIYFDNLLMELFLCAARHFTV